MTVNLDAGRLMQDLDELARIGATPDSGLNRVAFNEADRAGRAWVADQMRALGLEVRTDGAGNTIATYAGRERSLKPIALGSHTDTVPNGGRYDGALGVLGALAAIRAIVAAGKRLRHPVEVINFTAEEAVIGGGTFGSRAMSGRFDPAVFGQVAPDGRPVTDHLRAAGIDPEAVIGAARPPGDLAAYLELHVEQGGYLESAGREVGLVEGIVGIRRYVATFRGYANHSGTTPMEGRQDALVAAAPLILEVRDVARSHRIVGTVGTVRVLPGAANVIPGQVDLSVEIRGMDEAVLDAAQEELAERAGRDGGVLTPISRKAPVPSDGWIVDQLEAAATSLGLTCQRMTSGAGHDAMCMAAITREAMIFVPSRGGISHSPDEFTDEAGCVHGAQLLLAGLLRLDDVLDNPNA
jgi:N-carbamoyl-L-amino-acid hydrolase